jgi:hypothetical protein
MHQPLDDPLSPPAAMTAAQRRSEIAAILARGVLRLRQCREQAAAYPIENSSDSGPNRLDPGANSSPDVPRVNDARTHGART